MKKKYVKPLLETEEFVPQEYCQVCCGAGLIPGQEYFIYKETNGKSGYQEPNKWGKGGDKHHPYGTIIPCGEDHDNDDRQFYPGHFYVYPCKPNGQPDLKNQPIPVKVWKEYEDEHNYHIIADSYTGTSKS